MSEDELPRRWRLRMGANVVPGGVEFRVWAPHARSIEVDLEGARIPLERGEGGVWRGVVPAIGAGALYRYRIDDRWSYPDPYSRSQPDGPHGPSEVVDPDGFEWHDAAWRGVSRDSLVLYELHLGAYTPEGIFDALIAELDEIASLGVTAIELMPVAEFPGTRNWGYDGVDLFAPSRNYGGPEALRRLVDAAHKRGLGVILDVVYNHFGPDGNYLPQYAPEYLSPKHKTAWGDAINYDGPLAEWVRRLVVDNACYWLNEFHIDGLRLDATFAIIDESPRHILEEIATEARTSIDGERNIVLIAETYENDARYLRPPGEGGHGFDAMWVDDFHHVVHTLASREHSGYYRAYAGTIEELARTIERVWLFDGTHVVPGQPPRGTRAEGLDAGRFVYFIQNHDQVGNRAFGRRFSQLAGVEMQRAAAALHLLLPYTPMLFMGQEFAASSRFFYFTDHHPELGRRIAEGRRNDLAAAAGRDESRVRAEIPEPQDIETFRKSKLNLAERHAGAGEPMYGLHRALLALRRDDEVLRRRDRRQMRAIAASAQLLLVHVWHGRDHRLIAANVGAAIDATPEAAGVPRGMAGRRWQPLLSTDDRRFGGAGDDVRFDEAMISLPPHTVLLLAATDPSVPRRIIDTLRRLVRRR